MYLTFRTPKHRYGSIVLALKKKEEHELRALPSRELEMYMDGEK
jgi:hypothetical protein